MQTRRENVKTLIFAVPLLPKVFIAQEHPSVAGNLKRVFESYVMLETSNPYSLFGYDFVDTQKGIGVAYEDRIITLAHITNPSMVNYHVKLPNGVCIDIPTDKKVTRIENSESPLEQITEDTDKDVSVFRLPKGYNGKKFPFGCCEKVDYGLEGYIVGNPHLEGINVRDAIVSSQVQEFDGQFNGDRRIRHTKGFYVSRPIYQGDSGTAFVRKEDFALLGLAASTHEGRGFIRDIKQYKQYL